MNISLPNSWDAQSHIFRSTEWARVSFWFGRFEPHPDAPAGATLIDSPPGGVGFVSAHWSGDPKSPVEVSSNMVDEVSRLPWDLRRVGSCWHGTAMYVRGDQGRLFLLQTYARAVFFSATSGLKHRFLRLLNRAHLAHTPEGSIMHWSDIDFYRRKTRSAK